MSYIDYSKRIELLNQLEIEIKKREADILNALKLDMNKPKYEAYTSELGLIYREISHSKKYLRSWMKDKKMKTPIYIQPANSYIKAVPKGKVLIISPWNYPFLLTFSPLIGAISAGNKVVIKPSNKVKYSEKVIEEIVKESFSKDDVDIILGPGSSVVEPLIKKGDFDHIFFTGSKRVGKLIYKLGAENLSTITLELGGKSPAILDETCNLKEACKKITWGKFFNAGQTCIAPDYLIVHKSLKEKTLKLLKENIKSFYGEDISKSKDYCRIINLERFKHLESLIVGEKILFSGENKVKELFFHPTIIQGNLDSPIMKEEIFGPILPIITYENSKEIFEIIEKNPNPLALYLFSEDRELKEYIFENISFGGGCHNDVFSQMINTELPFGGVKDSGIGNYHSLYSFLTFSNLKPIVESKTSIDIPIKYPPYTESNLNLSKFFLK